MTKDITKSDLLNLYGDLTFVVDLIDKKVTNAYNGNEPIKGDFSFADFSDIIAEIFDLQNSFKGKLNRFFSNLNITYEPFTLPLDYVRTNGEPSRIIYKGLKIDDSHVLFSLSASDTSTTSKVDELTKTHNRTFIVEKVKDAVDTNKEFALMILSIDNYDSFNDIYGHMVGDIVLIEAVASIKKTIGNRGYIARIGGAEFLIMIYVENNYDVIHGVCRDIRTSTNDLSIHNIKQIEITTTVGCASYPKDGDNYELLFKKADKALIRGKKKGRDCFIIYTPERCGEVSLEDSVETPTQIFDKMYNVNTNYNVIAGVLEIINRDSNFQKNIEDSISLIGNYFLLDRITLVRLNTENDTIMNTQIWYNPRMPKHVPILKDSWKGAWRDTMDASGMVKVNQVNSNKHLPIYEELKTNKTSSVLAFEMILNGTMFGHIKFEMCSTNRFWQQNDISALMLISKIFAIKLHKEYENNIHYKELFYDRVTDIYNYNKWRNDIYNILENNPFTKYSILEFNIESYRTLKSVIGPAACEKILVLIANKLKELNKNTVMYCRDSDDKFLLFFHHQDEEEINKVFYDMVHYVDANNPVKNAKVTLHAGAYIAEEGEDFTVALDKAILARRQTGISTQLVYFSQKFYEQQQSKTQIELHMRDALKNNEFLLYLQPKINSATGKLVGAEALTRWHFNHEKLLFPNDFIPIFEENGFIEELDYKVFENVCIFQRKIIDSNRRPVPISVNVSRYITDYKKYISKINEIRNKYEIPNWLIEIEITEGMYINNAEIIAEFINMLHKEGYSVSMDDFGAGYSNLSSLATLDFDLIKLDKNFCKNQSGKETTILASIIDLVRNLNMNVLCEGVETQKFADYLKSLGCYIVQGYLYDKPLPEEAFIKKYIK
ncbi:MAG: bifunctional diguanylate cyclase/phosphodiesterase [Acholeplasmatales bacterium]|nr:bifunctional diguanylate cyclase/phosphodiesterase [Acholeplasmatales bacterium]